MKTFLFLLSYLQNIAIYVLCSALQVNPCACWVFCSSYSYILSQREVHVLGNEAIYPALQGAVTTARALEKIMRIWKPARLSQGFIWGLSVTCCVPALMNHCHIPPLQSSVALPAPWE